MQSDVLNAVQVLQVICTRFGLLEFAMMMLPFSDHAPGPRSVFMYNLWGKACGDLLDGGHDVEREERLGRRRLLGA